jgi:hypothetical protein
MMTDNPDDPLNFMELPSDVAPWFNQHVAEWMRDHFCINVQEARLRLGQKARYAVSAFHYIELRWDHWIEVTDGTVSSPMNAFIVSVSTPTGGAHDYKCATLEAAIQCWNEQKRKFAIALATKALGV